MLDTTAAKMCRYRLEKLATRNLKKFKGKGKKTLHLGQK